VANATERGSVGKVQATVRTFHPVTRSGTVLLDDGVELPYDDVAFDAGAVRLLRVGQRVRIEVQDDGGVRRVTYLSLATLPDRR
jgi:2-phospho-L-lactate guanylyltransferase